MVVSCVFVAFVLLGMHLDCLFCCLGSVLLVMCVSGFYVWDCCALRLCCLFVPLTIKLCLLVCGWVACGGWFGFWDLL